MRMAQSSHRATVVAATLLVLLIAGCAKKQPPVARPAPAPPPGSVSPGAPPAPPEPVAEPTVVPTEPIAEAGIDSRSLDDLNRDSPLRPAFFAYDSAEIDSAGQSVLDANADVLKKFPAWIVTIEGHCDERGTPEYNLALGERRALIARNYLVSLGIPADRLRTVSYGKEFPFDPGHGENAWARNRRAHFVITSK